MMSTLILEREIEQGNASRSHFIEALQTAVNAAERGELEVRFYFNGIEFICNFEDGELYIVG